MIKILEGIRVLELGQVLAAPFAGSMVQPMADAGFALTTLPLCVDGVRAGWDRAAPALGRDNAAHAVEEMSR